MYDRTKEHPKEGPSLFLPWLASWGVVVLAHTQSTSGQQINGTLALIAILLFALLCQYLFQTTQVERKRVMVACLKSPHLYMFIVLSVCMPRYWATGDILALGIGSGMPVAVVITDVCWAVYKTGKKHTLR